MLKGLFQNRLRGELKLEHGVNEDSNWSSLFLLPWPGLRRPAPLPPSRALCRLPWWPIGPDWVAWALLSERPKSTHLAEGGWEMRAGLGLGCGFTQCIGLDEAQQQGTGNPKQECCLDNIEMYFALSHKNGEVVAACWLVDPTCSLLHEARLPVSTPARGFRRSTPCTLVCITSYNPLNLGGKCSFFLCFTGKEVEIRRG